MNWILFKEKEQKISRTLKRFQFNTEYCVVFHVKANSKWNKNGIFLGIRQQMLIYDSHRIFSAQFCFCTMAKMCSLNYGSFCSINVHEHACNVTISIDMWGILAFKMFIVKRYFYANCSLQFFDVEHCKWIR